jgi:hypothetical protein
MNGQTAAKVLGGQVDGSLFAGWELLQMFAFWMREVVEFCFASLLPCKKHCVFDSSVGHHLAMHSDIQKCIFANAYPC